jgi:alpha-beta hydrolase superfamily lysophospholipase
LQAGLALTAVYVAGMAALYVWQERVLFFPTPLAQDTRFSYPMAHEEVFIDVPGATLHGILLKNPAPRGLIFYLHGNGGNVQSWTSGAQFYKDLNVDLFMLDYRGFGKSTGQIGSEAQLHADARAAWEAIARRYPGKPIALFGRSLGSGIAAKLATAVNPAATVLISPYRSIRAMAHEVYPFVPTALVRYPLDTEAHIARVPAPLTLIHGAQDHVIPLAHSQALKARAPRAKLVVIDNAGHNDLQEIDSYLAAIRETVTSMS